jgi:hypothetical protein
MEDNNYMCVIKSVNSKLLCSLIFLALMVIASCSGTSKNPATPVKSQPGTQTTFILVRHAERAKVQGESALRPEGRERAQALVDALGNMGVTAIYSPDRGRNRETVQPLADHLELSVNLISEDRLFNTREFADEFVREVLSQHAGGVVVWVGLFGSAINLQ